MQSYRESMNVIEASYAFSSILGAKCPVTGGDPNQYISSKQDLPERKLQQRIALACQSEKWKVVFNNNDELGYTHVKPEL